jgi:hypothetical protein
VAVADLLVTHLLEQHLVDLVVVVVTEVDLLLELVQQALLVKVTLVVLP